MQTLPNTYQTRFHGDNTGSNPVGDATKINSLDHKRQAKVNLK